MASKTEEMISQSLRTILADLPNNAQIDHSGQFQQTLNGLEFFLPTVLGPEWNDELDGFHPVLVRKIAEREVEIIGLCILINDQTLAPIHLRIQIASNRQEVSWLQCNVGVKGNDEMVRTPYESLNSTLKRMHEYCFLERNADKIDWACKVTYGERRQ